MTPPGSDQRLGSDGERSLDPASESINIYGQRWGGGRVQDVAVVPVLEATISNFCGRSYRIFSLKDELIHFARSEGIGWGFTMSDSSSHNLEEEHADLCMHPWEARHGRGRIAAEIRSREMLAWTMRGTGIFCSESFTCCFMA